MSDPFEQRVLDVLSRHVSQLNARVILSRSRRSLPSGAHAPLRPSQMPVLLGPIASSARLFVPEQRLPHLLAELSRLHENPPTEKRTMTIVTEHDVRLARLAARELCQRLGARTLSQQKVATAVSELSRNIASYTPGGELTLTPVDGAPPRLTILATDRGRGIAELESILSGTYRSRTGLGRGLRGVKQLMDRFEIRTGPTGTRIEAEAILR